MMATVEGFAPAFIDSVVMLMKLPTTNIPLPIPWPWETDWSEARQHLGIAFSTIDFASKFGFILIAAFPLIGVAILMRTSFEHSDDRKKLLMAATLASIPYAHYGFSRADQIHLSLAIVPTLLGSIAIAMTLGKKLQITAMTVLLSFSLVATSRGFWTPYLMWNQYDTVLVDDSELKLAADFARDMESINRTLSELASCGATFQALNVPTLHAMARSDIATWEIYPLFPRSPSFEAMEIERLEMTGADYVILAANAPPASTDIRYQTTHPRTHDWLMNHYAPTDRFTIPGARVYARTDGSRTSHPGCP